MSTRMLGKDAAGARAVSTWTGKVEAGARADGALGGGCDCGMHPGRRQELGVGFRQGRCPGAGGRGRSAVGTHSVPHLGGDGRPLTSVSAPAPARACLPPQ